MRGFDGRPPPDEPGMPAHKFRLGSQGRALRLAMMDQLEHKMC
jgi:hypothetical protein